MDEASKEVWYSLTWFSKSILTVYEWQHPFFLWLIGSIPLLFLLRWLWLHFSNQKLPITAGKTYIKGSLFTLLRFIPDLLLMLTSILIFIALARPQKINEHVEQWVEGIDIMLAIDISQSMQIEDFSPNRLEAAKDVARNFINGRIQDRIGIIVFSGEAFSLAPLTTDYSLLETYLSEINFDMIENRGTAIGSALAVATNRLAESDSKSKVCILLSDGDNTAGNIDPITAAELASAYSIKPYTILVGKEGLVPFGTDYFGRPRMVKNTVDETTMRKIATIGSGEFFRASNNKALENVFSKIDEYEKVKIKETRYKKTVDYYAIYLKWAFLFFLIYLLLQSTFLSNALQD